MSERREQGFTLVELLVSLAILSIALAVLFGAISTSLDRTRKSRDEALAASLVQSLLVRAGNDRPLAPGETSGVYSNGFRWHLSVRPYGNADDAKAWHLSAYLVRATVAWPGQAQGRTLTTLRLVPPPPAPQP
ncbi:MAG TPA: prepilin-type N-terminal cleavage/methylation domain-containing protein [Rhizomicrobium sp.]|jgi:type II secretion system protein I|nr:prepilin-type N-terminal cleavage/methylation domain-containing protein [Rhizomicrobium sp.]